MPQNAPRNTKKARVSASLKIDGGWAAAIDKSLKVDSSKLPLRDMKPRTSRKNAATKKAKDKK